MSIIAPILILIIGSCIGSFLSVVISRINRQEKGIFLGRSKCPDCGHKLGSLDLIPIISYILLMGKCRYCKKNIPRHYPSLELMTALLFLALYLKFQFIVEPHLLLTFIIYAIYGAFFVAIFFYDLRFSEIPDLFLIPLIIVSLLGTIMLGTVSIVSALMGIVIALILFGGQILISKGRWLGEGDLFLGIALAIMLGWKLFITALILSYGLGAFISLFLLLSKKVNRKSQVPFAPFLILGTFITIFFGEQIMGWYFNLLMF